MRGSVRRARERAWRFYVPAWRLFFLRALLLSRSTTPRTSIYTTAGSITQTGTRVLNYNEVLFEPLCSLSCLRMQLSLCNTSGQCYAYVGNETGYVQDLRSISYGKAKCQAANDNFTDTYVYWCYTHN